MAWRVVLQPNGLLSVFSDVVDNFTEYDMTPNEALQACVDSHECTKDQATRKILSASQEPDRFQDCLETIEIVHGKESANVIRKLLSQVDQ